MTPRLLALAAPWALSVVWTLAVYANLPDPMPSHWGPDGQADGYAPRFVAAWLLPAVHIGTLLLVQFLAQRDPRRENIARSAAALDLIMVGIGAFFAGLHILTLQAALSEDHALSPMALLALMGGLFVVIGAALPRLQPNGVAGIRTPWTLRDDRTWHRTHTLGGWLFVAAGLTTMVAGLLAPPALALGLSMGALLIAALVPVLWSWRIAPPPDGRTP